MILFTEHGACLSVYMAKFKPSFKADKVGTIMRIESDNDCEWKIEFIGRNWTYYTDVLDNSEKRQIIGMLDKLEGRIYRNPRSYSDAWNKIIRTGAASASV